MANAWIEFMKATKGSGMTMDQRKSQYRQQQAAAGRPVVAGRARGVCAGKKQPDCVGACLWAQKPGKRGSCRSPGPRMPTAAQRRVMARAGQQAQQAQQAQQV